jgi:L-fuculose-phosphate aldolase
VNVDEVKEAVLDAARAMHHQGLVAGTAGNVSGRVDDGTVVTTPSGVSYQAMTLDDLVVVSPGGAVVAGERAPTSEIGIHLGVLAVYPEVGGVVHTHARHASMFAVAHRPVPALIDEVIVYVGGEVPLCPYHEPGSAGLARSVAAVLTDRSAALLANHGLVTIGRSPTDALACAAIVEHNAAIAWGAGLLGDAVPLPEVSVANLAGVYSLIRGGWSTSSR